MVTESHQLPENRAAALHQTLLCAFQLCQSLLLFHSDLAGLLQEAPTPLPELCGSGEQWLILFVCPRALICLREESRDFLRCPQIFLTVWQWSACNRAGG